MVFLSDAEDNSEEVDKENLVPKLLQKKESGKQKKSKKSRDLSDIEKAQQQLEKKNKGKFFCVYFDEGRYWGRLESVFHEDNTRQ